MRTGHHRMRMRPLEVPCRFLSIVRTTHLLGVAAPVAILVLMQ